MTANGHEPSGNHGRCTKNSDPIQWCQLDIVLRVPFHCQTQIQFDQFFSKVRIDSHHIHAIKVGIAHKAIGFQNQVSQPQ